MFLAIEFWQSPALVNSAFHEALFNRTSKSKISQCHFQVAYRDSAALGNSSFFAAGNLASNSIACKVDELVSSQCYES